MSADGDRLRRELGIDLVTAEREECLRHPPKPIQKVDRPVDPRKVADEECGTLSEGGTLD